ASQAVHIICDLLEMYGQGGICAEDDPTLVYHNSFLIADPKEAWVLETAGKWWISQQIKDGVRNISNGLSIRSEYTTTRNGIIDHAIEQGYCENKDEFDFAKCFTKGIYLNPSKYSREGWGNYLLQSNYKKINPTIMMEILRDHYGGICMHGAFRTIASQVSYLSEKSAHSIHWMTGSPHPCISFFKPFVVPPLDASKDINLFEHREKLDLLENDNIIHELHLFEKKLIKIIHQRHESDSWSTADTQKLTQVALNRELSLISS
ncbi:MAG: hypothetical protein ACFFBQ_10220, partial [Promethearchaeota archaeon]